MGPRSPRRGRAPARLQLEQQALALEAASIAGQAPVGPDDAVAGNDDRDRIAAVGKPDRARGGGPAHTPCELAVGRRLPVWDLPQRLPDAALEGRAANHKRDVECGALAVEVLGQLPAHVRERLVGRPPLRVDRCRGAALLHEQAAKGVAVADQEQLAYRAFHSVVEERFVHASRTASGAAA